MVNLIAGVMLFLLSVFSKFRWDEHHIISVNDVYLHNFVSFLFSIFGVYFFHRFYRKEKIFDSKDTDTGC